MARKLTAVAAAAIVAAVLSVAPSQATVVDKGHYFSEPYSFSHGDCGFDVDVTGTSSGVFRVRAGKGSTATAFFGHDNYSFVETQTNPETGAFGHDHRQRRLQRDQGTARRGQHLRVRGGRSRPIQAV